MTDVHVSTAGYVGFGSFHSDNVEEILAIPADKYTPPAPPADLSAEDVIAAAGGAPAAFGAALRSASFYLDPSWTFVNHGAFGGACKVAMTAAQRWQIHCERQPLRYIDRELFPYEVHAIRAMAALVHCPPEDLVFIPHATYGINCAVHAAGLKAGDTVFMLDIGYGSVKKLLTHVCAAVGARLVVHPVRFPITGSADLVAQVEAALPPGTALAVFDHVTSNTAVVMPVAELTALAHRAGARVLIDGAHGLQSQPVDVTAIGADWYVSNCHKWLCSTKGVAILCCAPGVKVATRPLIVSHGFGAGFTSDFIWDGCRDYSGVCAIPALLAWWEAVGHDAARGYCRGLLRGAIALLQEEWRKAPAAAADSDDAGAAPAAAVAAAASAAAAGGADAAAGGAAVVAPAAPLHALPRHPAFTIATHAPLECYSHMACVAVPWEALPPGAVTVVADGAGAAGTAAAAAGGTGSAQPLSFIATSTHAKMVQDALHYGCSVEVPVKCLERRLYFRISAAVYNCLDDFAALAAAVRRIRWRVDGTLVMLPCDVNRVAAVDAAVASPPATA